jgi:fluoride exporter
MIPAAAVALGSALGGAARYGAGLLAERLWPTAFPWGTITINVLGSFAIGWAARAPMPGLLRLFLTAGVCGGFTTFSAFSLQTLVLARSGAWQASALNVAVSVGCCVAATAAGWLIGARLAG